MRIEFLGPPTSGKSTLHRLLREHGVNAKKGLEGKALPETWQPFRRWVELVYSERFPSLRQKTLTALELAYAADTTQRQVFFDEGLIQFGLSLGIRLPTKEARYFREVPLPGLLIVLNCPDKALKKRNGRRDARDRYPKTVRAVACIERILPLLEARNCPIIQFDTSLQPKKTIVKEVLKWLENVGRSRK